MLLKRLFNSLYRIPTLSIYNYATNPAFNIKQGGSYQETKSISIDNLQNSSIFETKFGNLKLVDNRFLKQSDITKISSIYYITNQVGSNYLKKILKEDKNCLILFDIDQMHYQNAFELYTAIKKEIQEIYFGSTKKPRNPFLKCKTAKDIFHLNRRILQEQKKMLSRICFVVDYNGNLRIQGTIPECPTLKFYLEENEKSITDIRFRKHDYAISFQQYQGILTAYNYERKGIQIPQLGDKIIHSYYGVWQPTQSHYLKLIYDYFMKQGKYIQSKSNDKIKIMDLGCGTGVLGFIAKQIMGKESFLYCLDNNFNAIKSAKLNSQILEIKEFHGIIGDITQDLNGLFHQEKFPNKYEIIICNPPWIMAKKVLNSNEIENGVYDEEGKILRSSFKFAEQYLTNETIHSQRGRFLLIYSDLSEKLGLCEENIVQKMCKEYNLVITSEQSINFERKQNEGDGLRNIKNDSKVILYEIQKY